MENLIIIGSGPAGLTAAVYASRAQLNPLVIEGREPGGQLTTTTAVENWPGSAEGIDGPVLMHNMRRQAERFGTRFQSGEITSARLTASPFDMAIGETRTEARCVIVATGASPRLLGLSAEKKLMGRGVSVCATCDGFFFRNKHVAVVGGGDSAMEEALYLSNLAESVTVIHRRDELRASKIMQQKAFDAPNITFLWNSIVEDIHDVEKETVTGATIQNVLSGESSFHAWDGVFLALGHIPNTDMLSGQVETDEKGFIKTGEGTATNIPGVFAAGDVTDPVYQQAVTAAGMGCMAALDAERFLRK